MMADEELQEEAVRLMGGRLDFVSIEQGAQTVQELLGETSPELVEKLQAYIAAGGQ